MKRVLTRLEDCWFGGDSLELLVMRKNVLSIVSDRLFKVGMIFQNFLMMAPALIGSPAFDYSSHMQKYFLRFPGTFFLHFL